MKKTTILLALSIITYSCDDFLDVEPKNKVIPTSIEDYDLLLNGGQYSLHSLENEKILGYSGNDFKFIASGNVDPNNPDNQDFQIFSYGKDRFYSPDFPVSAWNKGYENIYVYNKVINEINTAKSSLGYNETDKQTISAEAKYGRALDYFYLVNTFAKHYSSTNLDTDAVPIILEADVSKKINKRNSVGEVYDFILKDLSEALPNLPNKAKSVARPDKASGHALLARVNLYKGDYKKAIENATQAINLKGKLSDYVNSTDFEADYNREQFANRYFGGTSALYSTPNKNFKENIDTINDARYSKVFDFFPGFGGYQKSRIYYNQAPSIGEMYITRAEANARLGNSTEAIADLNNLRNHRILNNQEFTTTDFPSKTDLVKFILKERRREVLFTLTNLFDIKRKNLETEYAETIIHEYNGIQYKAEPNSGKLVLPIPTSIMKFNPNWKQN